MDRYEYGAGYYMKRHTPSEWGGFLNISETRGMYICEQGSGPGEVPSETSCPHKEINREGLWDLAMCVCVCVCFSLLFLSLPS